MLGHTENSSLMTRRKSSSSNQQEDGLVAVRRNGIDEWTQTWPFFEFNFLTSNWLRNRPVLSVSIYVTC